MPRRHKSNLASSFMYELNYRVAKIAITQKSEEPALTQQILGTERHAFVRDAGTFEQSQG